MGVRTIALIVAAFLIGLLSHQSAHALFGDGHLADSTQALLIVAAFFLHPPWDGTERRKRE